MDSGNPNSFNGTPCCIRGRTCQPQGACAMVKKASCSTDWPGSGKNVGFIPALKLPEKKKLSQGIGIITYSNFIFFSHIYLWKKVPGLFSWMFVFHD
jgi:hypothetical protein